MIDFTVNVPGVGKVNVVKEDNGDDEFFWDLFDDEGRCLNTDGPFWTQPSKQDVLTFFSKQAK
jgi:hypothetical protein